MSGNDDSFGLRRSRGQKNLRDVLAEVRGCTLVRTISRRSRVKCGSADLCQDEFHRGYATFPIAHRIAANGPISVHHFIGRLQPREMQR